MITLEQRATGCLLGLACGDAVGTTVEFRARGTFAPLTDMVGGGVFELAKGKWTDDTSMALCLADSLLACGGFNAHDQMERYLRWLHTGYNSSTDTAFDVGIQTSRALFAFEANKQPYSTQTDIRYSGNGSLMRLAPIALAYFRDAAQLAHYADLSSRTTHPSAPCVQACQYFAEVLRRALLGMPKAALFEQHSAEQFHHIAHICQNDFQQKIADDISSSGYVVHSLEAALWAFWQTNDFRSAILTAANLGNDADTVAAICGQIAGAYYGETAIPTTWLAHLYRQHDIQHIAQQLICLESQP